MSKINLAKFYLILHARQAKVRDADLAISCEPAETQKTGQRLRVRVAILKLAERSRGVPLQNVVELEVTMQHLSRVNVFQARDHLVRSGLQPGTLKRGSIIFDLS
jgi:hypothetical protein